MDEEQLRAARYSDLFDSGHTHRPNCAYCPICSAIGMVRGAKPELTEHLMNAARELVLAFGILVEEAEAFLTPVEKAETAARSATQAVDDDDGTVRRVDFG
ncbi:MAG TPA: hypothetical protein VNC78_11195 [Actinomycetota bacterium]|nr:hypothetical protein [Actinomycetota bacterium]